MEKIRYNTLLLNNHLVYHRLTKSEFLTNQITKNKTESFMLFLPSFGIKFIITLNSSSTNINNLKDDYCNFLLRTILLDLPPSSFS